MTTVVAIIGAGPVGQAVAGGLARAGHRVVIGVRQPDDGKYDDVRDRFEVTTIDAAVDAADVSVLAVPAPALRSLLDATEFPTGHVVVDATNAVFSPIPDDLPTVADHVAAHLAPDVLLVKAFNTIGAEHLGGETFDGQRAFLPIAGDDAGTAVVAELATAMGFDVVSLGGRDMFEMVEDHARLWIHLAFRCGWGRSFGFAALRHEPVAAPG